MNRRSFRSATSKVAVDGGESASLSLPWCAFLQLVHNLYWQPSSHDCPLTSQLSDHQLILWLISDNCCDVLLVSDYQKMRQTQCSRKMMSTRTIMGPLKRSHRTVSVIVTYAYSLFCLLPYQSVDCCIDIQQSLSWTQWKILERAKTRTHEGVAWILLSCNENVTGSVCVHQQTCLVIVSLRETLSLM